MRKKYDIIFVGAGLTNATIASAIASKRGYHPTKHLHMLVIDRRDHIAGNCYTKKVDGINVHQYGAHIFHTSCETAASWMERFGTWKHFINQPIAIFNGFTGRHVYNMPFNMNTFVQLFPGLITPAEVKARIDREIAEANITQPKNLAEQAISMVGKTVYEYLIKGYTEKQWGRKCEELPPDIIKRLPVRFRFDNNYFNDTNQMMPTNGYTEVIDEMFKSVTDYGNTIDIVLNTSYKDLLEKGIKGKYVFYSGGIDEFYDYKFGALQYRSVKFKTKKLKMANAQGCPVINYTSLDVPYTRSIEHKWFEPDNALSTKNTIVSYEYSREWRKGIEPYYPIGNNENRAKYVQYMQYHNTTKDAGRIQFVGRLGKYSYMDMDDCILDALTTAQNYVKMEAEHERDEITKSIKKKLNV